MIKLRQNHAGPDRQRGITAQPLTRVLAASICVFVVAGCATSASQGTPLASEQASGKLELNVNAACSEQQLHAEDASVITFAEGVRFDDVPGMMAASDLAVSGEVLNVQAGSVLAREVPAEPDAEVDVNQGFIPELVKVRVDEVFHHDRQHAVEVGDVITVQNYGWWADGHKPIEVTNYPTLCPGQDTFLFLTESALTPGRYVYVNSQGAYTVSGAQIRTGEVDDALVNELARLSPEALSEQARAASAAVSDGKVEAADDSAPVVSTPSAVPSG